MASIADHTHFMEPAAATARAQQQQQQQHNIFDY
jgi:hypothetical protein